MLTGVDKFKAGLKIECPWCSAKVDSPCDTHGALNNLGLILLKPQSVGPSTMILRPEFRPMHNQRLMEAMRLDNNKTKEQ